MSKFIQPVSMQVTKEQYERDLREPLLAMGYEEENISNFSDCPIINNNYGGKMGVISNTGGICGEDFNRHFIPEYNPEYFLAVASMTNKELGIVGEWWKFKSQSYDEFTNNKLYKCVGFDINDTAPIYVSNYGIHNGFLRWAHLEIFAKATLSDLITNFTENKQENIMKKEITTELIEELMGLIAPENEEKFNKLMGIEKPMFRKEDFITGDKVVLRNGKTYLVIRDCNVGKYGAQVFALLRCEISGGFMNSDAYDSNLNNNDEEIKYDIIKIYRWKEGAIGNNSLSTDLTGYTLIWNRD